MMMSTFSASSCRVSEHVLQGLTAFAVIDEISLRIKAQSHHFGEIWNHCVVRILSGMSFSDMTMRRLKKTTIPSQNLIQRVSCEFHEFCRRVDDRIVKPLRILNVIKSEMKSLSQPNVSGQGLETDCYCECARTIDWANLQGGFFQPVVQPC